MGRRICRLDNDAVVCQLAPGACCSLEAGGLLLDETHRANSQNARHVLHQILFKRGYSHSRRVEVLQPRFFFRATYTPNGYSFS